MAQTEMDYMNNGMLNINDASKLLPSSAIIEPTLSVGNRMSPYGTFYYKVGTRVCMAIGVGGLNANANNYIFVLPVGYRPYAKIANIAQAQTGTTSYYCLITIDTEGKVCVTEPNTTGSNYCFGFIEFDAFN